MSVRSTEKFKDFAKYMRGQTFIAAIKNTTVGDDVPGFVYSVERAIEQQPRPLQNVDELESLLAAAIECASYGFYADTDNGFFQVRNGVASYELQLAGIRSIAARHDVLISASIVHENDKFIHEEGDSPNLIHSINHQHDRGPAYLCYAIFKHKDGTILHREVMTKWEIEEVRQKSDNKNAEMWTNFFTEGWRKTVIRRGSKTVKLSPETEKAVCQVDRDYSFGSSKEKESAPEPETMVDVKAAKPTKPEKAENDAIDADAKEIKAPRKKAAVKKTAPKKTAKATPKPAEPEPIGEERGRSVEDRRTPEPEDSPSDEPPEVAKDDDAGLDKQSKFINLSADEAEALLDQLADQIDASETIDQLDALWKEHAEFIGSYDQDTVEWIAGMYEDNKVRLSSE